MGRELAPGTDLTVTWVEIGPGGRQPAHSHPAEQIYVIVAGAGGVEADGKRARVGRGDLVHLPGGSRHGIANVEGEPLIYVSAATPAIDVRAFYGSPAGA